MASAAPSLLPGQSPPLFTITPTDQAGKIVVITGVCLVVAVVSLLIRAYILVQFSGTRTNGDDWAIAAAVGFAIIQSSLVQDEAHNGLGRTIKEVTSSEASKIQRLEFADNIFYIIAVWLSKISVALFFLRLSPLRSNRRIAQGVIAVIAVSGIAAILIICIVCDLSHPWRYFTRQGITCSAPYNRWLAVSIIDIVTEAALAGIAIRIIWSLQIRFTKKIGVGFAFFQRLAVIAPILVRLHYLSVLYKSDDPTLHATYATSCKQIGVTFAIVAASIPCVRPFLIATATHFGAPAEGAKSQYGQYSNAAGGSSQMNGNHGGGSFSLQKLKLNKRGQTPQSSANRDKIQGEHFHSQNKSEVTAVGNPTHAKDSASVASDDSKNMIIRKDVHYNVSYYDHDHHPPGTAV